MLSDKVLIVNATFTFLGVVFTGMLAYLTLKLNLRAKDAAVKVEDAAAKVEKVAEKVQEAKVEAKADVNEVKQVLEHTTSAQSEKIEVLTVQGNESLKIGRATHRLVNNQTMIHLTETRDDKVAMIADRKRLFELTKDPRDQLAIEDAERELKTSERLLAEHIQKQKEVDAEFGVAEAAAMGESKTN
jgi:hypothetical protein